MGTTYPLVVITWADHFSNDSWTTLKKLKKLSVAEKIVSVGYLVHEDDAHYVLVMSIGLEKKHDMSMAMFILKNSVLAYKEIGVGALNLSE